MKGLVKTKGEEEPHPRRSLYSFKKIAFSLLGLAVLIAYGLDYAVKSFQYELEITSKVHELKSNGDVKPISPSNFNSVSNSAHKIYFDEEFKKEAVKKFSGSIQIETESYDNSPNPKDNIKPWIKFYKFHDYLKKTYPNVHKHLTLEKPNKIGLLYTWKGSDPDLKPLFLTAHQDVVPVDPLSSGEWTYPPYSGHFDGEFIWGRGTIDCKNLLIAVLQAVETLIEDGFKPTRTVILGFGSDEERGGEYGARPIGELLLDRYGPNSIYALVDEGSPVVNLDKKWYATPATTEKGHVNINIKLTTPGGHSSVPPDHTSIGIAAKLITLIENDPFKPILTSKNPFLRLLQEVAKHSTSLPESIKNDILRAEFDPKANQRAIEFIVRDRSNRYLIQSSQAIDIIHGGVKSNALPEFVEFVFNSRVSVDQTIEDVVDHVLGHVKEIAEEFNLGLYLSNKTLVDQTEKGYFNISYDGINTLPISPDSGDVWDVFAGTIKHVWDDVIFSKTNETVHVAPSLLGANTDTKHYLDLTPNIYRFFPTRFGKIDGLGIHSIDEHVHIDQHLEAICFIYEFIQTADESK